ncbi:M23 family metallopeptidase [Nocardia crassostreae]|uniref:M23 family metallopeptidase n=1 Tax=Nocardia crassostreae TaxID=53428 RepID=UPI000B26CE2B
MSDGPFPSRHRAKHGHRYREESENYGGATSFEAPQASAQVAHGEWGAARSWDAGDNWHQDDWRNAQQWQAPVEPQSEWAGAQPGWEDRHGWENAPAWDGRAAWNEHEQSSWDDNAESGWDASNSEWNSAPADFEPTATTNGWAVPNPDDWAGQSRTNWDPTADPTPSDQYRPAYSFRTASGERLDFAGDGAPIDRAAPAADSDDEPRATRSGGRRRAGGAHRLPAPPASLKGRAAVVAVAAGAVVAAGQTGMETTTTPHNDNVDFQAAAQVRDIAAGAETIGLAEAAPEGSPQVLNVSAPVDINQFNGILRKGQQYAADLAAQEAAKLRPLFAKFASGNFTSGYGIRWGVQHTGIDVAAPIGTPIYAVADGTVLESGPASGFGMWVRLLHDDGTVTIYGHIDTATVSQGQRVMAGDQIATVGNRGFSTGPHCHFEVWLNGVDKIDPIPWLASRGIGLGPQRD